MARDIFLQQQIFRSRKVFFSTMRACRPSKSAAKKPLNILFGPLSAFGTSIGPRIRATVHNGRKHFIFIYCRIRCNEQDRCVFNISRPRLRNLKNRRTFLNRENLIATRAVRTRQHLLLTLRDFPKQCARVCLHLHLHLHNHCYTPRATTERQPTPAQRKEKWRAFTSMF